MFHYHYRWHCCCFIMRRICFNDYSIGFFFVFSFFLVLLLWFELFFYSLCFFIFDPVFTASLPNNIIESVIKFVCNFEMKPLHRSMKLMFVVLVLFCICGCWLYRFCTKTLLYVLLSEFNSQHVQLSIVSLMRRLFSVCDSFLLCIFWFR